MAKNILKIVADEKIFKGGLVITVASSAAIIGGIVSPIVTPIASFGALAVVISGIASLFN